MISRFLTFSLIFSLTLTVSAQTRVVIQSVDKSPLFDKTQAPSRLRPKWSKFGDSNGARKTGEKFDVRWSSDSPLPAGASAVFRYRQKKDPENVRSLTVTYPMPISGLRVPTFTIGEKSFRSFGPVVWWEVSILSRGKALVRAEQP